MSDTEYLNTSAVKRRPHWTDTAIKKFMPVPDDHAPNPYYAGGAPMNLYLRSRIEQIEKSPEFETWSGKGKKKDEGYWVQVESLSPSELMARAAKAYNEELAKRGEYNWVTPSSPQEYQQHVAFEYVRLHLCSLEGDAQMWLSQTVGQYAKAKLEAIADTYPLLADECSRRLSMIEKKEVESWVKML